MDQEDLKKGMKDSRLYRLYKFLDKLLPLLMVLIGLYLYLDFLAPKTNFLYPYKIYLQYSILVYFVLDLSVLFFMYESNRKFFKNHWIDIVLTIPFITAFKGFLGLKAVKPVKGTKFLKSSKFLRGTKLAQKSGKVLKKGKKMYKKYLA